MRRTRLQKECDRLTVEALEICAVQRVITRLDPKRQPVVVYVQVYKWQRALTRRAKVLRKICELPNDPAYTCGLTDRPFLVKAVLIPGNKLEGLKKLRTLGVRTFQKMGHRGEMMEVPIEEHPNYHKSLCKDEGRAG